MVRGCRRRTGSAEGLGQGLATTSADSSGRDGSVGRDHRRSRLSDGAEPLSGFPPAISAVAVGQPVDPLSEARLTAVGTAPPLPPQVAVPGLVVGQQVLVAPSQHRLQDQAEIITIIEQARRLLFPAASPAYSSLFWLCSAGASVAKCLFIP